MAVTAYTGSPGAGKSYAMIEQVIIPAVSEGRRVLTNIEGVQPDMVVAHCIAEGANPDKVGSVVLFDGYEALQPGFFPTEKISDVTTFVKGGDLLVFDEWRLYWPSRGRIPNPDLEPFLRWHRHLTGADGQTCDVVIGSQLMTDIHRDFRGLCHRSYKFKKLDAVNASKAYVWHVFEGHLQPKGQHYAVGNGRYRQEITALYKSYSGDAKGRETATDNRGSLINWKTISAGLGVLFLFIICGWYIVHLVRAQSPDVAAHEPPRAASLPARGGAFPENPPQNGAGSPWRIMGTVHGQQGIQIVIASDKGAIRYLRPDGFSFASDGRPLRGYVDGQLVVAEDRFQAAVSAPSLLGMLQ